MGWGAHVIYSILLQHGIGGPVCEYPHIADPLWLAMYYPVDDAIQLGQRGAFVVSLLHQSTA